MEKIMCPAILVTSMKKGRLNPMNVSEGLVIVGYRHTNCLEIIYRIDKQYIHNTSDLVYGFVTTNDRFVPRDLACSIAHEAGQVHKSEGQLYSEDLY